MNEIDRTRYLRLTLRVVGIVFIVGIYPLTVLWPSGWSWHVGHSEYLEMIIVVYATLGVFLLLAASNPEQHLSLIAFTIWSCVTHGLTMTVQSLTNTQHFGHLYGDVPALFAIAAVLAWLSPRAFAFKFVNSAA